MRVLWILLFLIVGSANACAILEPDVQLRRDRADIARQAEIAAELARQADAVFIGTVQELDASSSSARVSVKRVLKGTSGAITDVRFDGLESLVVSCSAADMFQNTYVLQGRDYVFYIQQGVLLRAGWTQRGSGDLPLQRELLLISDATSS